MAENEVKIKRVTKDDYDKVMEMFSPGEIYSSTDYLSDYFHMLMDMSNVEAYVAVLGDKIVSFLLFFIVDGGKTLVSRAGRTVKEYEKHGFNKSLTKFFQEVSLKGRSLEYYSGVGGSHVKARYKKLETGERYIVLQKDFRSFVGTSAKQLYTQQSRAINIRCSAKLMNEENLAELLSNEKLCGQFFPEGRVIIDWVPYRLLKSNAALIKTERTAAVISGLKGSGFELLTFSNYFRAPFGLVCNIDAFGYIDATFKEHLFLHFKNIPLTKVNENVLIRCFCSKGTNWSSISSFMREFDLEERVIWGTGLMCSERKRFSNKL